MSFAPAISFSRSWTRAADLAAGEGVDLSAERRRRGLWSRVAGGGMESRGCKAGSGIEGPRHGLAAAQSAANALVSGGGTQDRVSAKNKTSRSMVKTRHTAGTKSFARWAEDVRQEDPEKKQSHRAKVYLATHRIPRKAKDKNKLVVELENIITEHPELAQMYGRKSRYLKNINVTTIDGSSHDGGADAMEEIAKLKQLIEQQDKIIDALRNNDGFRGANEITMENSQTIRNGESHPEVLHDNKRKRVQANGPGEQNTMIKPRDTVMKEIHPDLEHEDCNEFSYQEPSSLANHVSDVEIRKSKENMIENLTRLSKQSTQDKSLVHVSCKHKRGPSMKVGTQVILKSSTYPNKRHVAHATILGCKSKQLVGGVELGRQFIEAQVDQPIDEFLPLVSEVDNRHVAPVVVAVANVTTIVAATQKPVVLLRRRLQRHCLRFVQGLLRSRPRGLLCRLR
ncbi:hypothetical protein D1007_46628 [Hordeum vulgare]|nr:hypothetical protein D1007_46628 [Hordeum vulgare]